MVRSYLGRSVVCAALAVLVAALVAGPGYAQPVAGDNEIQVSGGFFKAQDVDAGSVTADVSYGYFLNRPWEIGIRQALNYNFIDKADDIWTATTIPFINYHFYGISEDRFVPFLGAFAGAIWNDDDVTGTLGPNVGAKIFLSDQTFFITRYRYEWFFDELDAGGPADDIEDGNHVVTIGLGFLWGGDDRRMAAVPPGAVERVEAAAGRAEDAAVRAEGAATKAEGAASRIEKVATDLESQFERGLRK